MDCPEGGHHPERNDGLLDVGVYALYIMQLMDDLRAKWGVRYPMD